MSVTEHSKITWAAENTHPELIEPFKQALQEVTDPEIGLSVVDLGLIRDLKIEEDRAHLTMILTTPFCPYGSALIEMARKKAEIALERPTSVELSMEAWDFSMMDENARADWGF